jgi:hypothetical protein
MSSRALYGIYESLDDCLLLYRYELANDLKVKFGINDLSKLDLNKIQSKSIILFHLSIYRNSPSEIENLLNFCIEKDIDIYIPISNRVFNFEGTNNWYDESERKYLTDIYSIVNRYDCHKYDFTGINNDIGSLNEKLIPVKREIKLRNILK